MSLGHTKSAGDILDGCARVFHGAGLLNTKVRQLGSFLSAATNEGQFDPRPRRSSFHRDKVNSPLQGLPIALLFCNKIRYLKENLRVAQGVVARRRVEVISTAAQ